MLTGSVHQVVSSLSGICHRCVKLIGQIERLICKSLLVELFPIVYNKA